MNALCEQKLYYDPLSISRRTAQKRYCVQEEDKAELLAYLIEHEGLHRMVIITKTKKSADALQDALKAQNIASELMHSNRSKQECLKAAVAFNEGKCDFLICTDKVFQAHEIKAIKYMLSYHLPLEVEDYYSRLVTLHEKGEGISFVSEQEKYISDTLQWAMKVEVTEVKADGFIPSQKPEAKLFVKPKKPRHKKLKRSLSSKA